MTDSAAWFTQEFASLHQRFKGHDYLAFIEALTLCIENKQPLPDWVAEVVKTQAVETFNSGSFGPGRFGNWRAISQTIEIDRHRAELFDLHLRARRRVGRVYVSELAALFDYGKPAPEFGGVNIVTRDDIKQFVSKTLRGKAARGSPEAVEASYKSLKRGQKRRRTKGGK